jgi:hypothetical protein
VAGGDTGASRRGPDGFVPVPDPTTLTTEAVDRATAQYRRELHAVQEVIEARLTCMDTERKLLLQLMDERASAIERRFAERDERFNERDVHRVEAVKVALDAAQELNDARDAATDKASGKFEQSVREQISQLAALAEASRQVLAAQISTLKERVDRGDSAAVGALTQRSETRLNASQLVAIIGLIVLIVSVASGIIIATR